MRTTDEAGRHVSGEPDLYKSRFTGWAPPRNDSTGAWEFLVERETRTGDVLGFPPPVYPEEQPAGEVETEDPGYCG